MVQRVKVMLVCDLHDGEVEGSETVAFGLDGTSYEIDLCQEHAAALREDFASYVGAARRPSGSGSGRRGGGRGGRGAGGADRSGERSGGKGKTAEVREWARANGYQVNERGRVPASVLEAYEAAHA